ncbi:unnamed protein product [Symbiodinium natans]|uniref:FHA domain-containing protein n=1 Tax=Symbiodinium natans TaxID=878477 RepID=A0A812UAI9_9DINO|nr:unnamed protein product [Symbiodinium natans]
MAKHKKRAAPAHRSADSKDLPPGWIRVESRSKPGAYFYAHPATKRTQLEHPGKTRQTSKRAAGPRRKAAVDEGDPEAMDVEEFEDPAEKAERLRQEAEEAEAAEAERQEMVRHQRAAKRALLRDAPEDKKEDESGSDEDNELVSKEELARWKETEEQREREEAEAERRRKEEEERRKREAEEAERRRLEEEERQREEEERRKEEEQKEKIALWKHRVEMARKEAEFELSMAKERQKKAEADKEVAKQLEAEKLRQALLERKKQEAEEEKKKAEADLRRKAEAERLKKEIEAKHQKVLQIPEPSDEIAMPCFDVFKGGNRIGRFLLKPQQKAWLMGRSPVGIDFQLGHETISRKHAQVNRQGCFTFLQDLGSAHGTSLNGQKLTKNTMERLCSGDNLRLGGSARTYVYREPSTAIQINTRGVRLKTPGLSEQELPEPPLDSPKLLPGKPSPQININLGNAKPQVAEVELVPEESPEAVAAGAEEIASRKVPPGSPEDQQAALAALESLVATTAKTPGTKTARPGGAPKEQTKSSKKSSSSSSSSSSARRKRKSSTSKKKKASSSSSSSKKRRKVKSKSKKRSSSSTSASREKARRKSKKKSSSSS